jgi:DNA polymerase-3 subunit gamma/tau
MAAQALYLKYRPLAFEQVVGQEPITRTLRNALRQGRLRHAYLFTGPRGTGKTTTARILAKGINCEADQALRPCNACRICVAVNEGRLMDLIEIDAASNRGIDEIRDIREKVRFRPNEGRFKVYVLDEAHMLTEPAFNALLKTLEEPPPHIVFALVTTEPHKIPATIASRCQRFDFRRIPLQAIIQRLAFIADAEGITVEPAALERIARQGTGAMRDAISLLDQLTSYGDHITLDQVQMVLGTAASELASELVAHLADGDVAAGLDLINRAVGAGTDPRQFGREILEYLRGLLLIQKGAASSLLNATSEQAAEMEALASRMSPEQLLLAIRLFNQATTDLKRKLQTILQLPLEMALVESAATKGAASELRGRMDGEETNLQQEPAVVPPSDPEPELSRPVLRGIAERQEDVSSADVRAVLGSEEPPKPSPAPHPAEQTSGPLSLAMVDEAWDRILQAVRRRNPAAEGAMRSGCKAVEVNGQEVVVTFPYPFLRDKLGDPQRRAEIQDALSEALGLACRLTLTLASEYTPRPGTQSTPASLAADEQPLDDRALVRISRWAEERGGQATIIQPGSDETGV